MNTTTAKPSFRRIAPDERRSQLIEASLACLAKGGIQAFTIDNICKESGTSRGLIAHHFGSKDALLAAVYETVYDRVLNNLDASSLHAKDLKDLIEIVFSDSFLNRKYLNVWLALWGEIAVNTALKAEHRKHYALYRERVARSLSIIARARGVTVDSYELATMFIALVDGLWLEQCIDSSVLSASRAKEVCTRVLEAALAKGTDA